jgi:hypothetical protein
VYWRARFVLVHATSTRAWLTAVAVGVLILSEFIPLTVGWEVADVNVADVLRGIRSGVVLIIGLAFLTVDQPQAPHT